MANTTTSWKPTKKWLAALSTGVLTIFAHWLSTGEFDGTERGQAVALLVVLTASYWKSNDLTPTGPPGTEDRSDELEAQVVGE